ncbi:MAG TPA: DNA mismatch repair protein MutS [Gemmatimonadaceae bacterium]
MSGVGQAPTPLMQQYREIKARHQNALLFFRMGEFYEMFYDDAEVASRVLGLTLTSRNNGGAADVPLAGVPAKAIQEYVRRLVQQGFRVAICEQTEDPKLARGIVRREVVETVTPGVTFAEELLEGARNNFICALWSAGRAKGATVESIGVAAADVSTGELRLSVTDGGALDAVLARYAPREIILPQGSDLALPPSRAEALITEREAWEFDSELATDDLTRQYRVQSLEGLGIGDAEKPAVAAAGALLRYLRELQPGGVPQLSRPSIDRATGLMALDEMTRRNLELVESLRGGGSEGTLLSVLDRTVTPMGARLLRQWVLAPLTDRAAIDERLAVVSSLVDDLLTREALRTALDGVRDVERLSAKIASGRASPRDVGSLGISLARLPRVEQLIEELARHGKIFLLDRLLAEWDGCAAETAAIRGTIVEHPPLVIGEEPTIVTGIDAELDRLRALRDGGKDAIADIQASERERTGIASLKVGFNKVFGYYIEVTKANLHLVPSDYQRRQTITNGERFVTPALKEYEETILTSGERIETRERELFEALRAKIGARIAALQCAARAIALLDVVASLAEVAAREGYVRPDVTGDFTLDIGAGRHPVVERMMPRDKFIPNDVRLTEDARVIILTGPNMAGKSTILRQVGLIVLMAQMGSFVPASSARVGLADRVFTRVGASDNLVRGQSTFMVEMSETSSILHSATARSLVLLDEIGRGTSTYDGVSIAWAVSEHLHDRTGCKTIFATHYHELTQLAQDLEAVRNFNVAVREVNDDVLFLHRLQPGGADRSYGIEVGRLAGLPSEVLERARHVLKLLEGEQLAKGKRVNGSEKAEAPQDQLGLFAHAPNPVINRLAALDTDSITPLQALSLLAELSRDAKRF